MSKPLIPWSYEPVPRVIAAATLPFVLAAMTACSGGSEVDSSPEAPTTTSSEDTGSSSGGGGSGGLGGGSSSTSTLSSTGTGGAGGAGGAGGTTSSSGGGGAGGCEPVAEVCNGLDDDCDGIVDNGNPGGGAECATGLKGICAIGHESCIQGVLSCAPDHGPGEVIETCNGLDDDCNGPIDDGLPLKAYYKDDDGDGFGTDSTIQACAQPPGYAEKGGDCNDNNPNIYPQAAELCNDIDDNCNGAVDEGVQKPTFYKDNDGDGYGSFTSKFACTAPEGYVAEAGDCNDFAPTIYPGAPELCNDVDDDCNGQVDDGLATQTIHKDNDGDGFAPSGALQQQKCNVPVGWALERDVDGDGVTDWDCNDSDVTVFPGAPTMCDGKDNDCDGVVDRLCFTTCAGTWPVAPPPYTAGGVGSVGHADLDGNGKHEILFQSDSAFQIVSATGQVLRQEGTGSLNYSRGEALVGDLDNYDQFTPSVQTLEVLTGNQSKLTHYKLSGGAISVIPSNFDVYDASPLMARDMDGDGRLELFTTSWCVASQGTRVFRYDRSASAVEHVIDIADPEGACEYTDGRLLTDLDGDGVPELLFGNGYSNDVPTWSGQLYARTFLSTSTLASDVYCAPGTCFSTDVDPLFSGSIHQLFRIGDELRTYGVYFAEAKLGSPGLARYWTYDLAGQPDAQSPSTTNTLWRATTDLDADGAPEDSSDVAYLGLFDVNGDGYPDRVVSNGKGLDVQLWDAATKKFASNPGSAKTLSSTAVRVGTMWDIDGSGRLAVLSTDESHNLYCHQLGPQTWLKDASLPPHFPRYLRTYQWDNYEPNEGADLDGDNMPDPSQIIQIPSALTNKGDFYGYLSTASDRDYYLIDAGWSAPVCLTSPDVASYSFEVYSFTDKGPVDGKPDGKVWEDTSAAKTKCFYPGSVLPQRQGEHKYIVGIRSQGKASPYWPYWLSAAK